MRTSGRPGFGEVVGAGRDQGIDRDGMADPDWPPPLAAEDAALTPQAKGRVERGNQTLQDRLIKEMRLCNVSSMEAAQAFPPPFMLQWNEKFAVDPSDQVPAHRPWAKTNDELDLLLARREHRVPTKALTFLLRRHEILCEDQWAGHGDAWREGAGASPHRRPIACKERVLALIAYGTCPVPETAVDEKTLDGRVDVIVAAARTVDTRSQPHP
jgi:hypothetical protein